MAFPLVLKSAFDPRGAAVWLSDLTLASKEGAMGPKRVDEKEEVFPAER